MNLQQPCKTPAQQCYSAMTVDSDWTLCSEYNTKPSVSSGELHSAWSKVLNKDWKSSFGNGPGGGGTFCFVGAVVPVSITLML